MTSVDSGVETENDSNDSLATHDSHHSMDLSPAVRVSNGDGGGAACSAAGSSTESKPTESSPPSFSKVKNVNDSEEGESLLTAPCTSRSTDSFAQAETCSEPEDNVEEPTVLRLCLIRHSGQKPNPSSEVDPPAGLSFLNLKPNLGVGAGYEVIGHNYGMPKPKVHLKMRCRLNKQYRPKDMCCDPFSKFGERKLRRAASTNNCEMVGKLLEAGVDPNCFDEFRRSPLHLSACRGYTQIVQMLLQKGANPNQKDSLGNTPLHLAACTNHVSVVTLLLKAGTDVHSSDHYGRSPLQLAQTRLKLLQRNAVGNPDAWQVKTEVQKVIEMMLAYLNRYGGPEADAELLSSFSSRLTLSQTPEEVDQELRGLLASLSSLSIDKPGPS